MAETDKSRELSEQELQELVAASDTGGRAPDNHFARMLIVVLAIGWSVFQLWVAQGQDIVNNFLLSIGAGFTVPTLGGDKYRIIHLAFAFSLAFLSYPAFASSPRRWIPIPDWIFAILGVFATFYYFSIFGDSQVDPASTTNVTGFQLVVAIIGILLLAEAARRSLGPVMVILGVLLLALAYFGNAQFFDYLGIRTAPRDFDNMMRDIWYGDKGIFGIPLGVSAQTVFMFVLFGALLDKAGAGNYFIKLAFGALGHLRGGPAKAAVVGSAATGLISGSSIANVVTTGTFTIPLMRRVGFSREKAGAVEVASSVNGQIMPPVMGAAAFLMVEYIGIKYIEVVKHAFVPAAISYIALVYLVHLEALKNGMKALPKPGGGSSNVVWTIMTFLLGFFVFGLVCFALQFPISFLKDNFGSLGTLVTVAIGVGFIIWLIKLAAAKPDLEPDDPNAEDVQLPIVGEIYLTGLYYVLPIFVLIYLLMIEQQSAGKSAFFAVIWLLMIMLIQEPLKAMFRSDGRSFGTAFKDGIHTVVAGLEAGARNMIGVAIATAAAGVIVAAVQMAQLDQKMGSLVGVLAGDSLILLLLLCAVFSLILGMGLPTTANYIIVSTIMVSVIVGQAADQGLVVPLIAAHLFVFYFGIMADVTPPVGLASFAAAAVSGGDPIKTGFTAFFYSLRTVALPFLFIFNTALILDFPIDGLVMGINMGESADFWITALWVFIQATVAMLVFAAALQGYWLNHSKIWESALLLLAAFMIFRPGALQEQIQPEFTVFPAAELSAAYEAHEPGKEIQFTVAGLETENFEEIVSLSAGLRVEEGNVAEVVASEGFVFTENDGKLLMENPGVSGNEAAEKFGNALDFFGEVELQSVQIQNDRLPAVIFQLPALLILAFVAFLQLNRKPREEEGVAA